MRLGAPIATSFSSPDEWVAAHRDAAYSAAYMPDDLPEGHSPLDYAAAARSAGLLIAEVGAWSNPISTDPAQRKQALDYCKERLALADSVSARCCVNISGSRSSAWDGPHPDNLTPDTFDLVVETVRDIVDSVKPSRTFYTLEPMPWAFPDSPESYARLLDAVDRPSFAVHCDPVNIISSPSLYFDNAALIRRFFSQLGPRIKSCHAKDITLSGTLTIHLDEVRPGLGTLDYRAYLTEIAKLDPDMPLLLEHLPPEDFPPAADHVRSLAHTLSINIL